MRASISKPKKNRLSIKTMITILSGKSDDYYEEAEKCAISRIYLTTL